MIVFELKCSSDHRFEAWFRDGAAYDAQVRDGALACPLCGDHAVSKAPMAPRIAKAREAAPDDRERRAQAEVLKQLREVRKAVEDNCDYVGDRFAEEARRIHYGETDARGIYGETTSQEAEELREEGVTFQRIPWLPRTGS
ncbi:DUF1178 family protein [Azospirillum sp. RWY-5-1]|uniref:DUF1178 family protein n=1 Tax=Azospirillum oleiclasticum TaxID=2735135 RepID=A0ABX2THG2_9PROT|nr:DUF1178 family protein [Azospirillum oleiclasticum]NYZ16299.1 DUF1178 family protein [Azospirillum oleiclasticum]NYZ23786.1 DUF1178 family protein [Azospirillum oleiclasticum]